MKNRPNVRDKSRLPRIQIRVSEEFDRQVKIAVAKAGIKQEPWVIEAVAARLRGEGQSVETGPYVGLSSADRRRAEFFLAFLRRNPEEIKDAAVSVVPILERLGNKPARLTP